MAAERAVRFGPYLLKRRIARGGMAEVFLAEQVGLDGFGRRVAVKRILPHRADAPDFIQMFLDEARLAAQLAHPNIVHIYDFGKADTDHFIAMEYVDGVNAGDVIKRGELDRMSPTMVARLGADAAAALHYAHELRSPMGQPYGLVHRDVSPANLMVSFDGVVKLCDFGIAKAVALGERQVTHPGMVKGKYSYMSPEQTVGAPLDGRSDVYTLAIVMWELLAGRVLVPRGEPVTAMRAIRDGKLTPIEEAAPWTPPELAHAVSWGLSTERNERPDAAQFAQTLEAFIKSSPEIVTAMHIGAWLRTRFSRTPAAPITLDEVHEIRDLEEICEADDSDEDDPVTTGETASVAARRVPGESWLSGAAHTPAPTALGTANTTRGTGPRPTHAGAAPIARSSTVLPSDAPPSVEAMLLAADALATGAAALIAASAQAAATRSGTRPRTATGHPREAAAAAVLQALGHEVPTAVLAFDNAETMPAPEAPVATAGRAVRRRAGFAISEPPPETAAAALAANAHEVPAAMPMFDPGETLPPGSLLVEVAEGSVHTAPELEVIEEHDIDDLDEDLGQGLEDVEPAVVQADSLPGITQSFDAAETLVGTEPDEADGTPSSHGDFDASAPHATAGGAPRVTAREVPAARVAFDTVETLMIDGMSRPPGLSGHSSIPMLIAPLAGPRREDTGWSTRTRTRLIGGMRTWQFLLLIAGALGVAMLSFAITWASRREAAASATPAPPNPVAADPAAPAPGPVDDPTALAATAPAAPAASPAPEPAVAAVRAAAVAAPVVDGAPGTRPSAPPWLTAPWPVPAIPLLAPIAASALASPELASLVPVLVAPNATAEPSTPPAIATPVLRIQTDPVGAALQVRRCRDAGAGGCGDEAGAGGSPVARCAASPCEFALPAGLYEIGADADGAHERREVTLDGNDATLRVDIAFAPNVRGNSPVGKLAVRTPSPCRALVDGRPRGQTPIAALELRPGPHRLELRCNRHASTTRTVTITAGRTTTVTLPGR